MRKVYVALAYWITVVIVGDTALAQDCQCQGVLEDSHDNGNGSPLLWKFETYVKSVSTAFQDTIICYHKKLENKTPREVLNVRWEVAGYFPPPLAPNSVAYECPELPGVMSISTTAGPLYYGVSSRAYNTIVRQPKAGWRSGDLNTNSVLRFAQATSPTSDTLVQSPKYPELRSEFVNSNYNIVISSKVEEGHRNKDNVMVTTKVENNGDTLIRVYSDAAKIDSIVPPKSSMYNSYAILTSPSIKATAAPFSITAGSTARHDRITAGVYVFDFPGALTN